MIEEDGESVLGGGVVECESGGVGFGGGEFGFGVGDVEIVGVVVVVVGLNKL